MGKKSALVSQMLEGLIGEEKKKLAYYSKVKSHALPHKDHQC